MNISLNDMRILAWYLHAENMNMHEIINVMEKHGNMSINELEKSITRSDDIEFKYKFEKNLGKGQYGTVWLVTDKNNNEKYAMKKISLQGEIDVDSLYREISILKNINNEHVVKYYNVFYDDLNVYIIMEYIQGKELYYYHEHKLLTPTQKLDILKQVARGIQAIHAQGVAHRDIKLENIMYADGNIKIIDFGFACLIKTPDLLLKCDESAKGTPVYISPEMWAENIKDARAADVWAFGILMFEILYGYSPDDANIMSRELAMIMSRRRFEEIFEYMKKQPDNSQEYRLFKKIFVPEADRIKIDDIVKEIDSWPSFQTSIDDTTKNKRGTMDVIKRVEKLDNGAWLITDENDSNNCKVKQIEINSLADIDELLS